MQMNTAPSKKEPLFSDGDHSDYVARRCSITRHGRRQGAAIEALSQHEIERVFVLTLTIRQKRRS